VWVIHNAQELLAFTALGTGKFKIKEVHLVRVFLLQHTMQKVFNGRRARKGEKEAK
jgi:hypothetical protein